MDEYKLPMSDAEIVRHYREAKDQEADIQVLADLNVTSRPVIRAILAGAGALLPKRGPERDAMLRSLYDEGLSDGQIAKQMKLTPDGVRAWRKRVGLPQQGNPGRPKHEGADPEGEEPPVLRESSAPPVSAALPQRPVVAPEGDDAAPEQEAPVLREHSVSPASVALPQQPVVAVPDSVVLPDIYWRVERIMGLVPREASQKARAAARTLVAELLGAYLNDRFKEEDEDGNNG